ncbi:MAG: adenylate/guanylate cyclase domain-containing protein [Lachnospiraceae bacterium]|nr:adenylate/guanylate cyclase domain-containing protein [Lachnospiraceae bacterium]
MKKSLIKQISAAAIVAALVTGITYLGALDWLDHRVGDSMFQKQEASSGKIVVIGIDEEALQEYGPFQNWDRSIMASALEALNQDPENKPAVVAIDTLYSGTTEDEVDQRLAKAAEELGCVVTGASASFGTETVMNEDGTYSINSYALQTYEESYDALKDVTAIGHINAMYDSDAVLRHSMLYLTKEDGTKVYSMAETVAELYSRVQAGETIDVSELDATLDGSGINLPKTDAHGNYYVAYTAKPGDFYDGVSIKDLINGEVPSDYFAGKIVFIGPYAAGLQDNVVTPIARAKNMYGVEYQANVVQQLLDENYKSEASESWQYLVLFLVCFLSLLFFQRMNLIVSSVVTVAVVGISIGLALAFYNNGTVTHPLWTPFGIVLVYVVTIVYNYLKSRAEKKQVTQTFERYVDTAIVNELLKAGPDALDLSGRSCNIAVLFVDIRGFTSMSEGMTPEMVVAILNEYLTMTSDCVRNNKGTLDKFVGDCTMAFWGAPLEMEDPVYHALLCARDIRDGAAELSKSFMERYGVPLNVGVGVNYGPAVVGDIGSIRRRDYTAIGDTVNTASRLESNAPAGKIYISRVVADMMGDRIRTTSLGATIKLKGKAEGFEVIELDGFN